MPIGTLERYPGNPRRGDVELIKTSVQANGQYRPLVVQKSTMRVLAGNHTLDSLTSLSRKEVLVYVIDVDDEAARRIVAADNRTSDVGTYDDALLAAMLRELQASDKGLFGTGYDDAALQALLNPPLPPGPKGKLTDRFLAPPFTVLDARQGWWQDRKRQWIDFGVHGEEGREQSLIGFASAATSMANMNNRASNAKLATGISVFDPVLAELVCKWFCPAGGTVLDPFAGDSTKGIVASACGLAYTGIELRQEQVDANVLQASAIPGLDMPTWVVGDSAAADDLLPPEAKYDLVFTSPPYYDLEVYSKDAQDGSAMPTYDEFMRFYRAVFTAAVKRLAPNRFLVIKVGEVRDKDGAYRNFVGDNTSLFMSLGLKYYNEAILVTAIGSLPIRAGRQFASGRKLGKTHQNVHVFFKGDLRKINKEFTSEVEFADIQP